MFEQTLKINEENMLRERVTPITENTTVKFDFEKFIADNKISPEIIGQMLGFMSRGAVNMQWTRHAIRTRTIKIRNLPLLLHAPDGIEIKTDRDKLFDYITNGDERRIAYNILVNFNFQINGKQADWDDFHIRANSNEVAERICNKYKIKLNRYVNIITMINNFHN